MMTDETLEAQVRELQSVVRMLGKRVAYLEEKFGEADLPEPEFDTNTTEIGSNLGSSLYDETRRG